ILLIRHLFVEKVLPVNAPVNSPKPLLAISVSLLLISAVFGVLNGGKAKALRNDVATATSQRETAERQRQSAEKNIKDREAKVANEVTKIAGDESRIASAEA